MEICVIKFGGTSLKEEAARNRAVRLIRRLIPEMKVIAVAVSYTHLRAHETGRNLVCRLLLEKKKKQKRDCDN